MDIHRADLAYRRRSLALLGALALLCGLGLWQWRDWLLAVQAHALASPAAEARRWLGLAIAAMLAAPVLPLALWGRSLRRLGRVAADQGRFPPREWKTYRDVRVLRGEVARVWALRSAGMGRVAQIAAGGCAAAASLALFWAKG
ncbi:MULTISPECIES: hypothetical protein [Lysobacter]|uniref:Transmembrane protein n=1 Tax=Lysobacter firmicutimachus TaxID=1792846 RepID=A0ABU8D439_9GAMM|nr:hypothetical protein [Lysobacter antibioticus]